MAALTTANCTRKIKDQVNKRTSDLAVLTVLFALTIACAVVFLLFRPNVQITAISFSTDEPVAGEPLTMTVTLKNRGWLHTQYQAVLRDETKILDQSPVFLDRGESVPVAFDLSPLASGLHNLSIGGQTVTLKLFRPATFILTDWHMGAQSLITGDSTSMQLTIVNTGEVTGLFDETLYFNEEPVTSLTRIIAAGQTAVIEVELVVEARGRHQVAAAGIKRDIKVLQPACISLDELRLSESQVNPGEAVTIEAVLINKGDLDGSHTVSLYINAERQEEKTVTLQAGQKKAVPFIFYAETAGVYNVQVADKSEMIQAVLLDRPRNGTLLYNKANSGSGRVTLHNHEKQRDAVFILVALQEPHQTQLAAYVHADSSAADIRLMDGDYIVYCTTGQDFDTVSGRFMTDPRYYRFHESINLTTTRSGNTVQYSVWTIEIGQENGNISTTAVQANSFFPG